MKQLPVIVLMILLGGANANAQNGEEQTIRKVLDEQTQYWNKGDLESFMTGYWNNDSLLFVGRSGPKYGYQTTLENYRKGYPDTTAMGKLRFDILQIKRLSVLYYFVLGKFHLTRTIGNAEGHFTLLFKKVKGKWVIVSDHSS